MVKQSKELKRISEYDNGYQSGIKKNLESCQTWRSGFDNGRQEGWDKGVVHGEEIGYNRGLQDGKLQAVAFELLPELKKIEFDRGYEDGHASGWYDCLDSLSSEEAEEAFEEEKQECELPKIQEQEIMQITAHCTRVEYKFPFIMTAFLYILSIFLLIKLFAFIYYGGESVNYNFTPPEFAWPVENMNR